MHRHPRSSIRVNRAVVARLARAKRWVLDDGGIEWEQFSSSLAAAPSDERVGVCVLTKKDGSTFRLRGENAPPSVTSVVVIVRPNGEQTLFRVGSLRDMLESTPRSFAGPRFD